MALLPQEIIRAKREGQSLDTGAISAFVAGLSDGRVTEGQAAAFAMAVLWRGMDDGETVALTQAMRDSGTVLRWDLPGPVLDKHSTGGVGDKVSLILAPLLAACGAFVPMISGRGLGHTGGTLDKMDAIPGYVSQPSLDVFRRVVRETGCAIVGATADLAPADRRLYAIRDVTATVESLPLITASILSKKFAEGAEALVMDVKCGNGAFLRTEPEAQALGASLVRVAQAAGVKAVALLTDMDQVLGRSAGNAVEVAEAIAVLRGEAAEPRLLEVTLALAVEALLLAGLAADAARARDLAASRLADGSAAAAFARSVAALGGPADILENAGSHLPRAPVQRKVLPETPGTLATIDVRALGVAIIALGGGRTRPQDGVDPRVGLTEVAAIGEPVGPDRPLAVVHAADEDSAERAATVLRAGMRTGHPTLPALMRGRIG